MNAPDPHSAAAEDRGGDARDLTGRWYRLTPAESGTDTGMYAPADYPFPPSRMPRESLELRADGTAVLHGPGPDDRTTAVTGTWSVTPANRIAPVTPADRDTPADRVAPANAGAGQTADTIAVDVGGDQRLLQVVTSGPGQVALRPVTTEVDPHDPEEEARGG